MTIIFNTAPQGSDEWLAIRRGAITGSRFKDARDRSDGLTEQQRVYVRAVREGADESTAAATAGYKKTPSAECIAKAIAGTLEPIWSAAAMGYAYDLAREREGGTAPETYVNAAMRLGTQEEPIARLTYEAETGQFVEEVGFAHTDDGKFGCSVDGLIGNDGVWECKTMVSSATLFKAMVDEDISEYRDQCIGEMWLLRRQWVDLTLWCPDLKVLHVIRIERDDNEIDALERDLLAFDRLVEQLRAKLRRRLYPEVIDAPVREIEPTTTASTVDLLAPAF